MKKFLVLIASLSLLLAACFPPNDNVTDPDPIIPDPVEVVEVFEGMWTGSVTFSSTDSFNNVEISVTGFSTTVEQAEPGVVTGTATFDTGLGEDCSLVGTQQEALVEFILICEDITGFSFSGEILEGRVTGDYSVTSSEITLRDGTFVLAYAGGN